MRGWFVCLFLLSLVAAPVSTFAQTAPPSSVTGRVLDPSGSPIAGAVVVASNGQAIDGTIVTDRRGVFQLTVPPGTYTVTVSADGFREVARSVSIPGNRADELDFTLALNGVRETVAVTAAQVEPVAAIRSATKTPTPLLNVPQSVTVVTGRQIQDQLI